MPASIRKSQVLGDSLDAGAPPEPDRPITDADRQAMALADAAEMLDKSPQFAQVTKYLPYIVPAFVVMSALTWGTSIYIMYKKSKHYYG
jgi:hypothetical protein